MIEPSTTTVHPAHAHADASAADVLSLWRRIRTTPIRDALRGRLSARYDVAWRIEQASLPEVVSTTIWNVVRRTRLWRSEKIELVDELAAHFHDGIETGTSVDDLVRLFGEVKSAAKLMRRAVKRRRPVGWKAYVRSVQGLLALVALFLVWYAAASVYYRMGSPVISHDYHADLTARARAVPENARAWPIYREAMIVIRRDQRAQDTPVRFQPVPGSHVDSWAETVMFVQSHEHELELLRRAGTSPGLGFVVGNTICEDDVELWPDLPTERSSNDHDVFNDSLFGMLLPHMAELRVASTLLSADAYLAAERGNGSAAMHNLLAILGTAEHARETPMLLGDLVALAIAARTANSTGRILQEFPSVLTDDQLRDLAHAIGSALTDSPGGAYQIRYANERVAFLDLIQRMYTDDGQGNGRITADAIPLLSSVSNGDRPELSLLNAAMPLAAVATAYRRDMIDEYERILAHVVTHSSGLLWQQTTSPDEYLARKMESMNYRARYALIVAIMPALARLDVHAEKLTMQRNAVLAAIAIELYRRAHDGTYPESLEALVPQYLPAVPIDHFTGRALGYTIFAAGTPVVYGVGADLDDDGGIAPTSGERRTTIRVDEWMPARTIRNSSGEIESGASAGGHRVPDGDWILWPPQGLE